MTSLRFREAKESDLPEIVSLLADDDLGERREDPSVPLDRRYLDAFKSIERDKNQLLVVAEKTGEIVGTVQLTFIPGLSRLGMLRGQLEAVRVAPAHRNTGAGRKMIEWAIAECRRRGCGIVQTTSDKSRSDAHRFYEALGFSATHEGMKLRI